MARHRALLLDYGGVLVESPLDRVRALGAASGIDPELAQQVIFGGERFPDHPWPRLECDAIDFDQYRSEVEPIRRAHAPGLGPPTIEWLYDLRPCTALVEHALRLRDGGTFIGIATNNARAGRDLWRRQVRADDFEVTFDSSDLRCRKPSEEFFSIVIAEIEARGLAPSDTVLVDDVVENADAARRSGLVGVVADRRCDGRVDQVTRLMG